ncbi:MAG: MotA/TolQ/ExbB proton channel family protein, partial [Bdellovibrionales bacterium]|nr:MotA/TolQ/ExbB proton channel family protein [Bdellovibrionales bacterium]
KKQLKTQTLQLEKNHLQREVNAQKEIQEQQKKLIALNSQNEILLQKLGQLEREVENLDESVAQLQGIIEQGSSAQDTKNQLKLSDKLKNMFDVAIQTLNQMNNVSVEKADFFLANGEKTSGQVINLGQIGKYGDSPQGQGVLYPVGDNKFKIWSTLTQQEINAIKSGQLLSTMPVFLYESSERGYIPKTEKTFLQTIQAGGSIAWVIVILGIVALIASLIRLNLLWKSQGKSVTRITASVSQSLNRQPDKIEDVIDEKILEESKTIDRFGAFIMVLAAVAPLLGLLGTVTGMIATFDTITQFGTGNPKLLSGGISEALITTMLGLIVAIPTLLMGNFLNSWSKRLKEEMERSALVVCNQFFSHPSKETL